MRPILSALLRNRIGLVLLGGQVALTLAIVVNAAFIAQMQLRMMLRPSGLDEANLLAVHTQQPQGSRIPIEAAERDLQALRALPGVAAAARINALPLGESGWRTAVDVKPLEAAGPTHHSALYYGDEKLPGALGLKVIDGRDIRADDLGDVDDTLHGEVRVALISRALAQLLFPGERAVGKQIYSRVNPPVLVIGVIDRLQSAWPQRDMHEYSMLIPARVHLNEAQYLVRSQPGALEAVRGRVVPALRAVDAERVIDDPRAYREIRTDVYRGERALATTLAGLIGALLFITALGVGGTAAFWVSSRTQQIGTRRALGASRGDILRHFMVENLLITTGGVAIGGALALTLNRWLMAHYALPALGWYFLPGGIAMLYALGQAAVLGPALRAAAVPPAVATRGA